MRKMFGVGSADRKAGRNKGGILKSKGESKEKRMILNEAGLKDKQQWQAKGYALPAFDREKAKAQAAQAPVWLHFWAGDIFSAILIGHLLDDKPLTVATQKAMDGVYELILRNKDNADKNRGIPLEQYLNIL